MMYQSIKFPHNWAKRDWVLDDLANFPARFSEALADPEGAEQTVAPLWRAENVFILTTEIAFHIYDRSTDRSIIYFCRHSAVHTERIYLDCVVDVDDIAAVKSRRRQWRDVNYVVIERVVAGLHFTARYAEYVALATVFRALRPHVDYLPESSPSSAVSGLSLLHITSHEIIIYNTLLMLLTTGALKMREWKMQEWKMWEQIAGVENAGVENAGVDSRGWKCRSGKCRSRQSMESCKNKYSHVSANWGGIKTCMQRFDSYALVPCGHQRFYESCVNEVHNQGRGGPISCTPINMSVLTVIDHP